MSKKSKKSNPEERAQRAVEKARARLEEARETHRQEQERAQAMIERVQEKASRRLAKATQRIERRERAVTEAESRLVAEGGEGATQTRTPETVADHLQEIDTAGHEPIGDGTIVVAQSVEDVHTTLQSEQ